MALNPKFLSTVTSSNFWFLHFFMLTAIKVSSNRKTSLNMTLNTGHREHLVCEEHPVLLSAASLLVCNEPDDNKEG